MVIKEAADPPLDLRIFEPAMTATHHSQQGTGNADLAQRLVEHP